MWRGREFPFVTADGIAVGQGLKFLHALADVGCEVTRVTRLRVEFTMPEDGLMTIARDRFPAIVAEVLRLGRS